MNRGGSPFTKSGPEKFMIDTILKIWMQYGQNNICTITINFIVFQGLLLLCSFLFCLFPLLVRWLQLKKANRTLVKELKKENDPEATREIIKTSLFKGVRWAQRAFLPFLESWEETRLSKDNKSSMPVQLRDYLTPDIVIESVGFQRISDALPGIFVAVGIFGTFYGLVLGLKGLDIEQVDQLQQGIGQLINGLSFAFITSLVGILLSVFFSLFHRFELERIEKNLLDLNNSIEEVFPFHSSERFAHAYSEGQNRIEHSLKNLAEDMAAKMSYKMGPVFGEAVRVHLTPVLNKIGDMMETHNEKAIDQQLSMSKALDENLTKTGGMIQTYFREAQDNQTEVIEKILEKYVDNLNLTLKNQLKNLQTVLEDTTHAQVDIKENVIEFNEKLQQQFSSQRELIDKIQKAGEILGETIDGFSDISGQFKGVTKDISKAADLMDSSAQKAILGQEVLNKSMATQMDAIRLTMTDLENAWKGISQNVEASIHSVHDAASRIGTDFDRIIEAGIDKYDEKVTAILDRFGGSISGLTEKYSSITRMLDKLDEVFKLIRMDITNQNDILKEIRKTAGSMIDSDIEKVVGTSEKLGAIAEDISRESVKNKGWFNEMLSNMNTSGEAFEVRNKNIIDEFSKLTDEIVTRIDNSFKILEGDSKLFSALDEFNANCKSLSQKIKGRDLDIIEPIVLLNENINDLTKHVGGKGGNGSEKANENLVRQMAAIEHQINYISTDLSEKILKMLSRISVSSDRLSENISSLTIKSPETVSELENQKGIFRRFIKR